MNLLLLSSVVRHTIAASFGAVITIAVLTISIVSMIGFTCTSYFMVSKVHACIILTIRRAVVILAPI